MKKTNQFIRLDFLLAGMLTILATTVSAQNLPWPYAHTLDSLLALHHVNIETPGFALLVVENGQIVYEKQAGAANIDRKIPVTEKTVFNIGSLSKQFTVLCILLLEEEGKLKRTDDVHLYIPELPDYEYPVTIRHLIGHTSGLGSYPELMAMQNKASNKRLRNQKMLKFQQHSKALQFVPGEDYNYSNTGYMLLCTIVERVSGLSLADFSQQRIFGPLGMHDTYFQQDGKKGVAGGTASYALKSGGKKFKKETDYVDALGATGVHTTLRDMVLWDQNFYHNLLGAGKQQLITQMETSDTLNSGASTYYGGGLFLRQTSGFREVEHTGGWGSFNAQYRRFPQQKTSIITASNGEKLSAFVVNNLVYRLLIQPGPAVKMPVQAPLPPGFSPDIFTGVYLSDNNWVRKVQLIDSTLFIAMGNGEKAAKRRLTYISSDGNQAMFRDSLGNPVTFYQKDGQVTGFNWTGGHYFPGERSYRKLNSGSPAPPSRFAGVYRSRDFGKNLKIKYVRRTNTLILCPFLFVKYRLTPVADTVYEIAEEGLIIRFYDSYFEIGDMWNRGMVVERR